MASNNDFPSKGFLERVAERIETHIEEWREQDRLHKDEAEHERGRLWAEALERERLLGEAVERSPLDRDDARRMVFVMHSEDAAAGLEELAARGARISGVIPEKRNSDGTPGATGSWLVFDEPV